MVTGSYIDQMNIEHVSTVSHFNHPHEELVNEVLYIIIFWGQYKQLSHIYVRIRIQQERLP